MTPNRLRSLALLCLFLLLAQACGPAAVPPSPTPLATTPAPTAEASETPTVAPTATVTPTSVPSDTPTPAPTADSLHTACDHPYWPLRLGATWEYTDGSANWTQAVTEVAGDAVEASATLVTTYANGDTVTFFYTCTSAGLLHTESRTHLGTIQSTSLFTVTGVHLLGNLAPGAVWDNEGTHDFSNSNGQTATNQFFNEYTAGDLETTQTVAGPFEALPVTTSFTNTTMAAGTAPITTTNWYAEGVGLVYANVGGLTKWDLVSYVVP